MGVQCKKNQYLSAVLVKLKLCFIDAWISLALLYLDQQVEFDAHPHAQPIARNDGHHSAGEAHDAEHAAGEDWQRAPAQFNNSRRCKLPTNDTYWRNVLVHQVMY
jgi:hypothetical protein